MESSESSRESPRIVKIEWARLEGQRPRAAGSNARIGEHGTTVRPALARLTAEDGSSGFGACRATREQAEGVLGARLQEAFSSPLGATERWVPLEYPLYDLVAKRAGQPVYALAAGMAGRALDDLPRPFRAPCYDTSLYFDDLHLDSNDAAAALIASEAREGYERGHRAFKIKVGRGGRHMDLEQGTQRDVAVIRAVRQAVGPQPPIMLDANNGYNLNLTKRVLAETASCGIFWMEEAFHEDAVLYRDLREWLDREGLPVLIADGEGQASPSLLEWARDRVVDVIQYDWMSYGFTRWLATGQQLDAWGARSAPHHYGGYFGNFAAGHLAAPIRGFTYVEWDEATVPGCDTSAYVVRDGWVTLPDDPGFGLRLDEAVFSKALASDGFSLSL
ncbi:MAG: mandelate racemase [Chloroflexota bacterium]|nr:mandelate racemase [Chloroflexota bacterium]